VALDKAKILVDAINEKQERCIKILEKEGFLFDNLNDKWQKLAFTFYSDICELSGKAKALVRKE